MAEYINKEELIKACNYTVCYDDDYDEETFGISEARIDLMPIVDIVRCKDCKYRGKHKLYQEVLIDNWCEMHGKIVADPDWFCADGEARNEVD